MKNSLCNFLFVISLTLYTSVWSKNVTCPPGEKIKNVRLLEAIQNRYNADVWDFNSSSFVHEGREWFVSFGTFLYDVKTKEEALNQGQAYFDRSPLIIKQPEPVEIPQHIYCDYMPTGRLYWIGALSRIN